MTEEHRERVTAFQIGVEASNGMMGAYLLPPDGYPENVEPVLLASVRQVIWQEPGMRESFNEFVKAIATAMVTRHTDPQTAATLETERVEHPDDQR